MEEGSENMNVRDTDEVILRMRSSVASKQFGQEDKLCSLIAEVISALYCFMQFHNKVFIQFYEHSLKACMQFFFV